MTQQKLKHIVRWTTIAITTFFVFALIIVGYQCIQIATLNARIKNLDSISSSLTQRQEQLTNGIEVRESGSYLDQTAREQLGMAQDGDKLYVEK